MRLSVRFPDGELVAEVQAEPECPFAQDPESGSFVLGLFTPGSAFSRIRVDLDAFLAAFDTGDLSLASRLHEEIDSLGLVATDSAGRAYRVWNVLFQEGGLLFQADPQ
jgi:hypothetical protein